MLRSWQSDATFTQAPEAGGDARPIIAGESRRCKIVRDRDHILSNYVKISAFEGRQTMSPYRDTSAHHSLTLWSESRSVPSRCSTAPSCGLGHSGAGWQTSNAVLRVDWN